MVDKYRNLDTAAIHAGELDHCVEGAVTLPIFQSSTYEYTGESNYADVRYIRLNNTPNHRVLHAKLAALESAEAALVTASGMAAISATLLSVLSAGDHLLAQDKTYGGTYSFLTKDFASLGLTYDFFDAAKPDTWTSLVRPETKAIYVESITNPTLQVGDLRAVVEFARQNDLVSIIDNTFATPVFFRPLEVGFDLVVHSGTKYLNGHTDMVAGAVAGGQERVERINAKLLHLGGSLDPHACFLLHRGLKTLGVRVRQQSANALAIAKFLSEHSKVKSVRFPGLSGDPNHARANELFCGFGAVVTFEPEGGLSNSLATIDRLELPIDAPSLGGVESLVTRPAVTSHSGLSREQRAALGISDGLIRYSVGIEAAEDLVDDLRQALDGV